MAVIVFVMLFIKLHKYLKKDEVNENHDIKYFDT